jgi:hypothetical protein
MHRRARNPDLKLREGSRLAPWRPPAGRVGGATSSCQVLSDLAVAVLRLLEAGGSEGVEDLQRLGVDLTAACIWTEAFVVSRSWLDPTEVDCHLQALDEIWSWWEFAATFVDQWSASAKTTIDEAQLRRSWRLAGRVLGELLRTQGWLWSVEMLEERDQWVLAELERLCGWAVRAS